MRSREESSEPKGGRQRTTEPRLTLAEGTTLLLFRVACVSGFCGRGRHLRRYFPAAHFTMLRSNV
jgi:hypothetical protein